MKIVSGLVSKVTKNADKVGVVVGALSTRTLDLIIADIQTLLSGGGHLPDINNILHNFTTNPMFKQAIILWLVGYVGGEFGYQKYGKPIQKFSVGLLQGHALQTILWASTNADEGSAAHLRGMLEKNVFSANRGNPRNQEAYVQLGYGY